MFTIGTKVRVVRDNEAPTTSMWIGRSGTVQDIVNDGGYWIIVRFSASELPNDEGPDGWFTSDELEIVN